MDIAPPTLPNALRQEQVDALHRWLGARTTIAGWLDGFSLGRSYVDTRQRSGKTYHDRAAYVRLDHATARIVPEMAGQSGDAVKAFLAVLDTRVKSNDVEPF